MQVPPGGPGAKGGEAVRIERWKKGRLWAVYDESGELLAVVVYKKGAQKIVEKLSAK